jgi:3-methyladenine DNA glycosylase Tag
MGTAEYCQELFKEQSSFIFWADKDIIHNCQKLSSFAQNAPAGDKCASLNEGMFKKYHET